MTSLGNDIVALSAVDAERTKRESFYTKILAPSETTYFHDQLHEKLSFDLYLWLLWTIKESAFKCVQRHHPELIFSPRNVIIKQVELTTVQPVSSLSLLNQHHVGIEKQAPTHGTVEIDGKTLFSRSIITPEWIFSIVSDENDFEKIHWGIQEIADSGSETQQAGVRMFILEKLKEKFPGITNIIKSDIGYPVILNNGQLQETLVSFTHHDKLASYVFS